jgi:uncharacterized YigZ family protein
MRSIARNGSHAVEIQRSRFVCSLARVQTADQATAFIVAARKENWSATHNCSAYRVGTGGDQQRSSDDGEPAGTAGVPMLEVLIRRELTDTVAVVTRYFGGIKLGAGGLVRAYGRAIGEAIDGVGTVVLAPHTVATITIEHAGAGRLEHELRAVGRRIRSVEYGDRVLLTVLVPPADIVTFTEWLAVRTGGRAAVHYGADVLIDIPV